MVSTSKQFIKTRPSSATKERKRRSQKVPMHKTGSDVSAVQKTRDAKKGEKQVALIDCGCDTLCATCMQCQCTDHVICDYDANGEASEYDTDDHAIVLDDLIQISGEDGDVEGTAVKTVERACRASKKAYKVAKKAHKAARKAYKAAEKCQMALRKASKRTAENSEDE